MKITIQMIRDELGADVEETFIRSSKNDPKVETAALFEPDFETEESKIYLLRKNRCEPRQAGNSKSCL